MSHEIRIVLKGGILLALFSYINILLRIIVSIIIVSYLGPELYGIRGILLGAQSLIYAQVFSLITTPFTRELSARRSLDSRSEYDIVFTTVFITIIGLSFLLFLIYEIVGFLYFAYYLNYQNIELLLLIAGSMIPIQTFQVFVNEVLRSELRYLRLAVLANFRTLIDSFLIILIALIGKITLENVFFINLVSSSISACLASIFLIRIMRINKVRFKFSVSYFRKFLSYMTRYGLGSFLNQTFYNLDSFILPHFLGLKFIGYYYFGKSLLKFFLNGIRNVKSLFLPFYSHKLATDEDKVRKYVVVSLSFSIFVINIIVLPFVAFSKQILIIISLLIKEFDKYLASYWVVSAIVIYTILLIFQHDIVIYSDSKGKFQRHIFANFIALVTYLTLIEFYTMLNLKLPEYFIAVLLVIFLNAGLFSKNIYWSYIAKKEKIMFPWRRIFIVELILISLSFLILVFNNIYVQNVWDIIEVCLLLIAYSITLLLLQLLLKVIRADQIMLIENLVRKKTLKKLIRVLLKLAIKLAK